MASAGGVSTGEWFSLAGLGHAAGDYVTVLAGVTGQCIVQRLGGPLVVHRVEVHVRYQGIGVRATNMPQEPAHQLLLGLGHVDPGDRHAHPGHPVAERPLALRSGGDGFLG